MNFLRDRIFSKVLHFVLKNKFLSFSVVLALFIITIGSVQGGIIRTSFFPIIASDRVQVTLKMPEGTHVDITDSLAMAVEDAMWQVNASFKPRQTGGQDIIENVIRRIGPGSANATITANLLPGELRDFPSFVISNAIQDSVGQIYEAESLIYGSGSNFGGRSVAVSILGNNITELKGAKEALKRELNKLAQLKDISDNDPEGIKEIKLELKKEAYLLGLSTRALMNQVRNGFFGFK